MRYYSCFSDAIRDARRQLHNYGNWVDTGHWQGVSTEGKPDLETRELLSFAMSVPIPDNLDALAADVQPNLPWADEHFRERVGGDPTNPGEAYQNWPWWRGQYDVTASTVGDNPDHDDFRFDHTYQERFWPKYAAELAHPYPGRSSKAGAIRGIRYEYGDLRDVVDLLFKEPYTRQAYLPIFFPEDTGAAHGGRIPCTLGYQFMLRDNKLHCWYFIRSCDFVRHFKDDIYLAARLCMWVLAELVEAELRWVNSDEPQIWVDVDPGNLNMVICSLHYHRGDQQYVWNE